MCSLAEDEVLRAKDNDQENKCEVFFNFIDTLPVALAGHRWSTRAQQLLRWATVWQQ